MFVFAIETNGKTVAFTMETDHVMLDGVLNGHRDEGQPLREGLLSLQESAGTLLWDGVSPFTARLATVSEALDYHSACDSFGSCNYDSMLMFLISNDEDGDILVIPPNENYDCHLKEVKEAIASLVEEGLVVDSGRKRRSNRTGKLETVWMSAETLPRSRNGVRPKQVATHNQAA